MNAGSGKTLVLGLGNDVLTDDAVGLQVAREVRPRVADLEQVDVRETTEMGLALLDFIVGYDALVLVDSIQTGRAAPGHVHDLTEENLSRLPGRTPHFLGLGETLALGHHLGLAMPERVKVFGIEVADPFTLGKEMTPPVQAAVPPAVEQVLDWVRSSAAG